jgi:glycosyltransferase involved in cell wall biosynthesis
MTKIDISFVITVYNKDKYIRPLIESIRRQTRDIKCEFIFVDDASTDHSIAVIETSFFSSRDYIIIKNEENLGPAIRLNQGCSAASGEFLFLIDADDMLVKNGLSVMMECLRQERADFAYGGNKVIKKNRSEIFQIDLPLYGQYYSGRFPLDTVLANNIVRMSYLVKREVYLKSGGADEKIFIQDESLPLRLAKCSERIAILIQPAVYGPIEGKSLSKNEAQKLHDRFYAYYNFIHEFSLTNSQNTACYKRAVSTTWKAKRLFADMKEKKAFMLLYLKTKLFTFKPDMAILETCKSYIDGLENVRKML